MFSLHLKCLAEHVDAVSFELWEVGTVGIREEERGSAVELVAGFEDSCDRKSLSFRFAAYTPQWQREDDTDWVAYIKNSWPGREVGMRLFLAPVWNEEQTPRGRVRVIHNPGLASGTGEHPCTQLALESLERTVSPNSLVVDVGAGSAILAVAARRLGARAVVALDLDFTSLATARENFQSNDLSAPMVMGSADCIASEVADVVVANISATVLMAIADELLRIVKAGGWLILTGFPESELATVKAMFGGGLESEMNEWRGLTLRM